MKVLPILLLLILVGCNEPARDRDGTNRVSEDQTEGTAAAAPAQSPGLLYAVVGSSGSFSGSGLVMNGLSDDAVYFAERPGRNAGQISLADFSAFWKSAETAGAIEADPPNAIISLSEPGKGMAVAVLELLDGTVADSVATFSVRVLEGTIPEKFDSASLVIDAFPTSVNGQITDFAKP